LHALRPLVMIIANDATVKAAHFSATAKKLIRAPKIFHRQPFPTIYLVDSAGVFLPLQEDVFLRPMISDASSA